MNIFTPAKRLDAVGEYYFSRKLKQIADWRASGRPIISLAIGGPDMEPPRTAIDVAVDTLNNPSSHSYQMTIGTPDLRRAYTKWYSRVYNVNDINPDTQILPLIGSKEAILAISMAYINPGDVVLVPNPGYPTYSSASRLAGAEVVYYDLDIENQWYPDFDVLETLALRKPKIMWVNYPHMPTGTPASIEIFHRLVDFGRRYNVLIVNDNPYSTIMNPTPLSILSIPEAWNTAVELNSLSKCMNMAGWRLGMLIGREDIISNVLRVKSNVDSGQPKAMIQGAIAALEAPKTWYARQNEVYSQRQNIAQQIFDALGCSYLLPQQGLFLWARIPEVYPKGFKNAGAVIPSAEAYSDKILEETDVFLTPGFIFGSAGEKYLRLSLCAPENVLKEALARIKRLSNSSFEK